MKKVIGYILVGILMLVIGFGGAYLLFDHGTTVNTTKNNEKEENATIETKNLDVYSDEVVNTLDSIRLGSGGCDGTSSFKAYFKNSKVTSENVDQLWAYIAISSYFGESKESISTDEWNNIAKKLYGDKFAFDTSVAEKSKYCTHHYYDMATGKYEYQETACGCTSGPFSYPTYTVSKAEITGDKLTLNIKTLFPNQNALDSEGRVKYYKDSNLTQEISDLQYSYNGIYSLAAVSGTNFSKAGNYKFEFEKNSDESYHFVSSEYID